MVVRIDFGADVFVHVFWSLGVWGSGVRICQLWFWLGISHLSTSKTPRRFSLYESDIRYNSLAPGSSSSDTHPVQSIFLNKGLFELLKDSHSAAEICGS